MNKLVTIIPLHEFNESVKVLLLKALNSIDQQKNSAFKSTVHLVIGKKDEEEINSFISKSEYKYFELKSIINPGGLGFQEQINFAFENIESEYISIVEFDDEVNSSYYKNMIKYLEKYPEIDMFLPIIIETDSNNKGLDLRNQHVWSKQFVGENNDMGFLNTELLDEYSDFKICGSLIKRSKFLSVGKLKTNIELTFQYEFLLRLLNNNAKIFTLPKLLYKHMLMREGSLFDFYQKNTDLKTRKFWFETAKKESYFNNQREINLDLLTK